MEPGKFPHKTQRKTQLQQPSFLLRKVPQTVFAGRGYKPLPLPALQHRMYQTAQERSGMKIMRSILCAAAVILLAGCTGLPTGKAPEGKITDNQAQTGLSGKELEHHAATALCAYILSDGNISAVNCADKPSFRVLEEISVVTGTVCQKAAPVTLKHQKTPTGEYFILRSSSNKTLWRYPADN